MSDPKEENLEYLLSRCAFPQCPSHTARLYYRTGGGMPPNKSALRRWNVATQNRLLHGLCNDHAGWIDPAAPAKGQTPPKAEKPLLHLAGPRAAVNHAPPEIAWNHSLAGFREEAALRILCALITRADPTEDKVYEAVAWADALIDVLNAPPEPKPKPTPEEIMQRIADMLGKKSV